MSNPGEASKSSSDVRVVTGEQQTMLAAPAPGAPEPSEPELAAVQPSDWMGREVAGRYRVLERIGEGGMGIVYVAEHMQLMRKVAFKVIHPELAANEDLLLRFRREALATGQLDHPHIASAIDFDQLPDGMAFMVMPWVRGHSLQAEVDSGGKLSLKRACLLGSQIADALSAAHAVGIVHRDLKPDNVLLELRTDGSESCKVLDFGVASLTGRAERISVETSKPLTQAGTILGTPGYMSPEQATAGEIDHRTDLYALGVMLWELCRGERLFDGDDVTAIFAKQFNSIPPALALGVSQPATELSQLVQRLLAWNKQERPESAAEVRDTLRRIAALPDAPTAPSKPDFGSKRTGPIAIGLILILGMIGALFGDDGDDGDDKVPVTPTAVVAPQQQAAPVGARKTAKKAEVAPVQVRPTPAAALRLAQDDVINAKGKDTRRDAARLIQGSPGQAPRFVELVAELELSSRCPDRKELVEAMRSLGDPRVLPALQRLDATPRRGCGMLRLSDCNACVRRELAQSIEALGAVGR